MHTCRWGIHCWGDLRKHVEMANGRRISGHEPRKVIVAPEFPNYPKDWHFSSSAIGLRLSYAAEAMTAGARSRRDCGDRGFRNAMLCVG
jgi:hypothetical protein